MLAQKGGRLHRLAGKVYFWAMFTIFMTSLTLLIWRTNVFLTVITLLSFYATLTGYRVLSMKRSDQPARWLDWSAAGVAILAGAGFMVWGAMLLIGLKPPGVPTHASIRALPAAFPYLSLGFGAITLLLGLEDVRRFRRAATDRNQWWFLHIRRMLTAYIATTTAFMAQQVSPHLPMQISWICWVLPSLIGGPGIYLWVRYYQQKFNHGRKPTANLQTASSH